MISWFSETKKLHFNLIINDHQDYTWIIPQCASWISLVRMYSFNLLRLIHQTLPKYWMLILYLWLIHEDLLFWCKLTFQTEHCYFPRCAMTPKVNTRHKQQCVCPVELRELSILPGQSSHVIFIFKFYRVFGIPYLNKQVHVKSAWS